MVTFRWTSWLNELCCDDVENSLWPVSFLLTVRIMLMTVIVSYQYWHWRRRLDWVHISTLCVSVVCLSSFWLSFWQFAQFMFKRDTFWQFLLSCEVRQPYSLILHFLQSQKNEKLTVAGFIFSQPWQQIMTICSVRVVCASLTITYTLLVWLKGELSKSSWSNVGNCDMFEHFFCLLLLAVCCCEFMWLSY